MKKKDILPCVGKSFVLGTLLIQTFNASKDHRVGSLIGLAAATIIFIVMNYSFYRSCCDEKSCDVKT